MWGVTVSWYVKVLKQYVDFSGRARRREYWMFVLINVVILIVLSLLDTLLGTGGFRARPEKSTYCLRTLTYQLTLTPHFRWRSY